MASQTGSGIRSKRRHILWAVDALEAIPASSPSSNERASDFLRSLENTLNADITPVFVLSPDQMNLGLYELPDLNDFVPSARRALESRLAHLKVMNLKPPRILVNNDPSLRHSVAALIRFADQNKFDWIVAGSHGGHGFDRYLIGSFAEELLIQSRIPVLVIGKSAEPTTSVRTIVFPTNFTPGSERVFRRVLSLAQDLTAQIRILHVGPDYDQNKAYDWMTAAKRSGVTAVYERDTSSQSVIESVLKATDQSPDTIIAMTSHSGRWSSLMRGNFARKVVRTVHRPVWVMRA